MYREIEAFCQEALLKMKEKHWDKVDLVREASLGMTTINSLFSKDRLISQRSIRAVGKALDIQKSLVDSAVGVSRPWSGRGTHQPSKPTISGVEERLRKAMNHFTLARKELKSVDEDIERVLGHLIERMRSLNGLKSSLEAFEKH